MTVYQGYQYRAIGAPIDFGNLTVGVPGDSVKVVGEGLITFMFEVTGGVFSGVILRLMGSLDGDKWFQVGSDLAVDSAGVYQLSYDKCAPLLEMRPEWVQTTTGTPTVACKATLGQP